MNREIKFRAWYKKDGRMIDLYKITPLILNESIDGLFIPFGEDYELMQSTGLKDKNGKEIYEGDIVKLEGWNPSICEVTFDRGGFCIRFGEDDGYYPDIKYVEGNEIIGNIYENSELLNNK